MNKPPTLQQQAKQKYLSYIKLFPSFKPKNLAAYTTIILTLLTMAFFIVFAIKPTIATIVQLKKQIKDSQFLDNTLKTKIASLITLKDAYATLGSGVDTVSAAIPKTPAAAYFLGQIQTVISQTNTQITTLQVATVPLTKDSILKKQVTSFSFSLSISGPYQSVLSFIEALGTANRLVSYDSISITKEANGIVTAQIEGKAYFIP